MKLFSSKKIHRPFVEPDEIFLDSSNLPKFDSQQFEGRIERPIAKRTILFVGSATVILLCMLTYKLGVLQVAHGNTYRKISEQNALLKEPLFADRGVVTDRNGTKLIWNEAKSADEAYGKRLYIESGGFGNLLGYISYPKKDTKGVYWRTDFVGADGVEKVFNADLSGINGARLVEHDVAGNIISGNVVNTPIQGKNITLSIDATLQAKLYDSIRSIAEVSGYKGGAGAIINVHTGEILTLTTYPQYDSKVMSDGSDANTIKRYFSDSRKPFLNRAVAGLYSPGSIIKPFMGLGALTEGVVTEHTLIASHGTISLPNPYNPSVKSVFRDYRDDNGIVDIRKALAVSSNIYFFNVIGGYQSQKGIGIDNVGKYISMFGIGKKTGITIPGEVDGTIPSIAWKAKVFPNDPWRIGDTYNTAIGQYGFQVTPIQMLRAVAAIANRGTLLTPTILKAPSEGYVPAGSTKLAISDHNFSVIQEGMRMTVTDPVGTVKSLVNLHFKVAAKTGTAQVGVNNELINSWIMGFFPYDTPHYAFVVVMEKGTNVNNPGATAVAKNFLEWLELTQPEYIQ